MNATGKLDAKYSARWESCPLRFGAAPRRGHTASQQRVLARQPANRFWLTIVNNYWLN